MSNEPHPKVVHLFAPMYVCMYMLAIVCGSCKQAHPVFVIIHVHNARTYHRSTKINLVSTLMWLAVNLCYTKHAYIEFIHRVWPFQYLDHVMPLDITIFNKSFT